MMVHGDLRFLRLSIQQMSWNCFFRSPNNGENIEAKVERQNQCGPGPNSAEICGKKIQACEKSASGFLSSFNMPRLLEPDAAKNSPRALCVPNP